jgi:Copper type II ascorbate-dependent monooxygenase, C-terminal domain
MRLAGRRQRPWRCAEREHLLGSYLPGKDPDIFPEGYARKIPKGAILEFQIHYNSGSISKEEMDRTSVGLIFAKEPPKQILRRVDISNYLFQIPANNPDHKVTACYTFNRDVELMSYTAHMHLRGKDMKFEAIHPDGKREILVSIPNYDFNWQTKYKPTQPVQIESGTQLDFGLQAARHKA